MWYSHCPADFRRKDEYLAFKPGNIRFRGFEIVGFRPVNFGLEIEVLVPNTAYSDLRVIVEIFFPPEPL